MKALLSALGNLWNLVGVVGVFVLIFQWFGWIGLVVALAFFGGTSTINGEPLPQYLERKLK